MSFKKTIEYYWFQPYTPFVILLLVGFLLYQYGYPAFQKAVSSKQETNPASVLGTQTDQKAILDKLSKLMTLPSDETPRIATITDPDALKDKPFFKNAQKGQKLIIYGKNRLAILFDPVDGKIIGVAPIAPSPTASPLQLTVTPTPELLPTEPASTSANPQ